MDGRMCALTKTIQAFHSRKLFSVFNYQDGVTTVEVFSLSQINTVVIDYFQRDTHCARLNMSFLRRQFIIRMFALFV